MIKRLLPKNSWFSFDNAALFVILLGGFLLRIWGISFGLPNLYHADEPLLVNHALAFGGGDLNPHYFKTPSFGRYLLFCVYGIYYFVLLFAGKVKSTGDFLALFLDDPSNFYLLGRMLFGAISGTLTVLIFYRLSLKFFSKKHALLAGLFLATNFLHVQNSHYLWFDIPLLLIVMACFFSIFQLRETNSTKDYLLFSVLAGLAVGMKYNGVFVFIPFIVMHFLERRLKELLSVRFIGACILSVAVFFVVNPFALFDFRHFFYGLFAIHGFEGYTGFTHHLRYSLVSGMGFPLLFFSLAGLVKSFFEKNKKKHIFTSFIVSYYLVLVFCSQRHDRYALLLIPPLLFFAADFLLSLRLPKTIRWLLVLVAVIIPITKSYLSNQLLSKEDVRTSAQHWVDANLPENSNIAMADYFFMPRLKPSIGQLREKLEIARIDQNALQQRRLNHLLDQAFSQTTKRFNLFFLSDVLDAPPLFARPVLPYDLSQLKEKDITYVLFCKIRSESSQKFYEELKQHSKLVHRFTPYKSSRVEWVKSPFPLTGSPSEWNELIKRQRNGQIIELFKLHQSTE